MKRSPRSTLEELCQDLAGIEWPIQEAGAWNTLLDIAKKHQVAPGSALRMVQYQLAPRNHDVRPTAPHDRKIKPDVVEVCLGKTCQARGSAKILAEFQRRALQQNQTPDAVPLKVKTCSCQHHCSKGPNVRINGTLHEKYPIPE